jgi:hypothetical protein
VAKEEIFGPVVTVTVFDTEEEAIEIANASEYGLFAGIYTSDSDRYPRVARKIDVGVLLINYFRGILGFPSSNWYCNRAIKAVAIHAGAPVVAPSMRPASSGPLGKC